MTGDRAQRVQAELTELARQARAKAAEAVRQCEETSRLAEETTGELGRRWGRRIQVMRQRPGAARADWRNDQLTDD